MEAASLRGYLVRRRQCQGGESWWRGPQLIVRGRYQALTHLPGPEVGHTGWMIRDLLKVWNQDPAYNSTVGLDVGAQASHS